MKRLLSYVLAAVMFLAVFMAQAEDAYAAAFPSINSSRTVEFIAVKSINVYSNASLRTRGTSSPYRNYNARVDANDKCYIHGTAGNDALLISYPTGSGYRKGYCRRTDVLYANEPVFSFSAKAGTATYKKPGGAKYGSIAARDSVYVCGGASGYKGVIYNISGGKYKLGWIREASLNAIRASGNANQGSSASGWQMPMTNAYVCGNNWLTYYRARPSRPYHLGLDLASGKRDSNVYAASGGQVAAVGYNSANGKYVIIRHAVSGKTVYSFYCHLSSYSVSRNRSISKGQKIGVYGNTGSSSAGAHLHFAIANKLNSSGGYYGYGNVSKGDKATYNGTTFYNPHYVIKNGRLP